MILLLALQAATGAAPALAIVQPVVMRSECHATDAAKPGGGFLFEAISTDGKWSNRISPLPGSDFPAKMLFFAEPSFKMMPTPKKTRAIWNMGNLEVDGFRYHFFALSEIPDQEPTDFAVDLSKSEIGPAGKNLVLMQTKCKFINRGVTGKAGAR